MHKLVIAVFFLFAQLSAFSQDSLAVDSTLIDHRDTNIVHIAWTTIAKGVDYCFTDAPYKSIVNDSKLTILRIDPKQVEFEMHVATAEDRKPKTVKQWADTFGLNIVFNAGMYDMGRPLTSRGMLKLGDHYNQELVHPTFNSYIALNPYDTTKAVCKIFDMECDGVAQQQQDYECIAQGLRMLNCDGVPANWKKRVQSCSMLVSAQDKEGNFYLIFTRSPYVHNTFISILKKFPFQLVNAIYMEGGPETSLYVSCGDFTLKRIGSYVSKTYEKDNNNAFWPLPNVIGIRTK